MCATLKWDARRNLTKVHDLSAGHWLLNAEKASLASDESLEFFYIEEHNNHSLVHSGHPSHRFDHAHFAFQSRLCEAHHFLHPIVIAYAMSIFFLLLLLASEQQQNSLQSPALFGLLGGPAVTVSLVVVSACGLRSERGECKERFRF